jgi:hypothetical protein
MAVATTRPPSGGKHGEDRMQAITRRKLEMGRRALDFSRAHPDQSAGYGTALARLEERLARADQLANVQRQGILDVRTATARKQELRRAMTMGHLNHLARVARQAAVELPELDRKFLLTRDVGSYLSFRTAARGMAAEAVAQKELLVKHGLAEFVLDDLEHTLDKFETAIEQGDAGRRGHMGATAELMRVADDVVAAVAVLNGLNRIRFAGDGEALAGWEGASSVLASPRRGEKPAPGTPPASGEVKPAA